MPRQRASRSTPASPLRALARVRGPLVLAVSGGLDSMALLHIAASSVAIKRRCVVATFDHATGAHTRAAVRLVRKTAASHGIPSVSRRATRRAESEAEWRAMRWGFLNEVAAERGARIVTAHTRDDQIETVVMRVLRGAGARGIAALYAESPIVRPLLGTSRRALERFAHTRGIPFVEDPSNLNRRFLRNRVRHDLLPALRAARPDFEREMLRLSRRAATLRRQTETVAARVSVLLPEQLAVDVHQLATLNRATIAVLWPAIVARLVGSPPLDRRGIVRATDFALRSRSGQQAQCTGLTLRRTRNAIIVARQSRSIQRRTTVDPSGNVLANAGVFQTVAANANEA